MREAQGTSLLGVLRLDRDPLGTEDLQNWVLSRTENTECQVPFYPENLRTRETTVLCIPQEGPNERRKSQRARTATLWRRGGSAASGVWVEMRRAGRSGCQRQALGSPQILTHGPVRQLVGCSPTASCPSDVRPVPAYSPYSQGPAVRFFSAGW